MKAIKIILLTLFSFVAVLLVISFFLKSTFRVEKSIEVKADPETVYSYLADFNNMEQWSPWKEMDSTQKVEFEGAAGAVGALMRWESNNQEVGKGTLTRIENIEGKGFVNTMKLEGFKNDVKDLWNIEATADGSKITWTVESDLGSQPWMKYIAIMVENGMGDVMPKGLNKMKEKIESLPATPVVTDEELAIPVSGFESTIKMTDKVSVAYIRKKIKIADINKEMGLMYGQLTAYITKNGLKSLSPAMAIYYDYNEAEGTADLDACMPVDKESSGEGDIKFKVLEPIKVLSVAHTGNYETMKGVYDEAMSRLESKKVSGSEGPREIYLVSAPAEKDPAKWKTEIQFPVKN